MLPIRNTPHVRSLTRSRQPVYEASVKAAIHTTRVRPCVLAVWLLAAFLLAAFRQADHPACYRTHCRAAAARHSLLAAQARHGGNSSWYPEPLRNVDLTLPRSSDVSTSIVRQILRVHRIAFGPVAIRRLKLPPLHSDPF